MPLAYELEKEGLKIFALLSAASVRAEQLLGGDFPIFLIAEIQRYPSEERLIIFQMPRVNAKSPGE